jgi:hypothetical protein
MPRQHQSISKVLKGIYQQTYDAIITIIKSNNLHEKTQIKEHS